MTQTTKTQNSASQILEYCGKVTYWKLMVSLPTQLINSKHLKRFSEPLSGLHSGSAGFNQEEEAT